MLLKGLAKGRLLLAVHILVQSGQEFFAFHGSDLPIRDVCLMVWMRRAEPRLHPYSAFPAIDLLQCPACRKPIDDDREAVHRAQAGRFRGLRVAGGPLRATHLQPGHADRPPATGCRRGGAADVPQRHRAPGGIPGGGPVFNLAHADCHQSRPAPAAQAIPAADRPLGGRPRRERGRPGRAPAGVHRPVARDPGADRLPA